jgi:hypothetical protein
VTVPPAQPSTTAPSGERLVLALLTADTGVPLPLPYGRCDLSRGKLHVQVLYTQSQSAPRANMGGTLQPEIFASIRRILFLPGGKTLLETETGIDARHRRSFSSSPGFTHSKDPRNVAHKPNATDPNQMSSVRRLMQPPCHYHLSLRILSPLCWSVQVGLEQRACLIRPCRQHLQSVADSSCRTSLFTHSHPFSGLNQELLVTVWLGQCHGHPGKRLPSVRMPLPIESSNPRPPAHCPERKGSRLSQTTGTA